MTQLIQVAAARCINFTVRHVLHIGIVFFSKRDILIRYRDRAGCRNVACTADVSAIGICQLGIRQSAGPGKAVFRFRNTQVDSRIDLGQSILARHSDRIDSGIRSALDPTLDIVINLADCSRDPGSNGPAAVSRRSIFKFHTAGHLDIPVIGTVVDCRTAAAGVNRIIINQKGMHLTVHLVHGKAKSPCGVSTGSLAVIRHGDA